MMRIVKNLENKSRMKYYGNEISFHPGKHDEKAHWFNELEEISLIQRNLRIKVCYPCFILL